MANDDFESALRVNSGVEQPSNTHVDAIARLRKARQRKVSDTDMYQALRSGDRVALGKAITLIESNLIEQKDRAEEIVQKCLPHAGNSVRIGITGVPGVGKSSFIETFGQHLIKLGKKVAVLAIDPSSERSQGSILGDKTRMEALSADEHAFIRPTPSAGTMGGVARKTREAIVLCEAAGYDVVLIETVGVGQSETIVNSMVDFFLFLVLAGAGDELQGIKRGIMEMADLIAITKSDGGNIDAANRAKSEYQSALHLFAPAKSGWVPQVLTCSSHKDIGIGNIWGQIEKYVEQTRKNGFFEDQRREQATYWMFQSIESQLKDEFFQHPAIRAKIDQITDQVKKRQMSSFVAARKLIDLFRN